VCTHTVPLFRVRERAIQLLTAGDAERGRGQFFPGPPSPLRGLESPGPAHARRQGHCTRLRRNIEGNVPASAQERDEDVRRKAMQLLSAQNSPAAAAARPHTSAPQPGEGESKGRQRGEAWRIEDRSAAEVLGDSRVTKVLVQSPLTRDRSGAAHDEQAARGAGEGGEAGRYFRNDALASKSLEALVVQNFIDRELSDKPVERRGRARASERRSGTAVERCESRSHSPRKGEGLVLHTRSRSSSPAERESSVSASGSRTAGRRASIPMPSSIGSVKWLSPLNATRRQVCERGHGKAQSKFLCAPTRPRMHVCELSMWTMLVC
jgi:hypothetical protein